MVIGNQDNIVDNFDKFEDFLNFESPDDFYFCQVIRRGKDSNLTSADNYHIKAYFIKSIKQLRNLKDEMINMCHFHNARVYIHLNKRSFKKCAFRTLKLISEDLVSDNYEAVKRAYTSVCGSFPSDKNKKWLIDVDLKNLTPEEISLFVDELTYLRSEGDKFILCYPTRNGVHLIIKPFDLQTFNNSGGGELLKKFNATIFKDGMSLLYCNIKN